MFTEAWTSESNQSDPLDWELARAERAGSPMQDADWGLRHIALRLRDARVPVEQTFFFHLHDLPGRTSLTPRGASLLPAARLSEQRRGLCSEFRYPDGTAVPSDRVEVVAIGVYRRFRHSPHQQAVLRALAGRFESSSDVEVNRDDCLTWEDNERIERVRLALAGGRLPEPFECSADLAGTPPALWFESDLKVASFTGDSVCTLPRLEISDLWYQLQGAWLLSELGQSVRLPNGRRVALDLRTGEVVSAA